MVQDAVTAQSSLRVFESMADLILSSEDPVIPEDAALLTMQDLVNAIMQIEEATKSVTSRWIRVVIQLSLAQNPGTTEGLIPQLMQFLRSDKVGMVEAHWIAATLWNKALDYYAYVPCPYCACAGWWGS